MIVVERPLSHPRRVDVVTAESVDAAMTGIGSELTRLRSELIELEAEAHQLECRVEEAGRRTEDSDSALPMLERVFATQASTTRVHLRAALDEAVEIAERRLSAARAEADSLVAGVRFPDGADRASGHEAGVVAGSRRPGGGDSGADTPAPEGSETLRTIAARHSSRIPDEQAAVSAEKGPVVVHARAFPDEAQEPTGLPDSAAQPLARVRPSVPALTHEDPGSFGQFWAERNDTAGLGASKPALLDALLPLIAVAIVVIVVLSWIG